MATTPLETATPTRGHPVGLYALFFTEMWERFSYYGMRALLVLYLVSTFRMERDDALGVYALYTGLVYLTPLFGGRLADRFLGQRKTVFIGGSLMALGQFALMLTTTPGAESLAGMSQAALRNLGLGLLIVGNGFFKPNISTMVGTLYPDGDARKDTAYTIFYMGINTGALIAPLICGYLGERWGWQYGFGAAGVGMVLGLVTFVFTQRVLQGSGLPPGRGRDDRAVLDGRDWIHIVLWTLVGFAFVLGGLASWPWLRSVWAPPRLETFGPVVAGIPVLVALWKGVLLVGVLAGFIWLTEPRGMAKAAMASEPLTREDWQRIAVIGIISLFSIVFWMGFEQSGGTFNLFALEKTDRHIGTWEFPTSWLQSVNPAFILIFAPGFVALWTWLARHRMDPPSFAKQGVGLLVLAAGFGIMYFASEAAKTHKVSWLWLFMVYVTFTAAELCVSPIGLSLVNKLAPPKLASLMMAFWFLCTAAANYLAGIVEALVEPYDLNLWLFLGGMAAVPGVLLVVLTPLLRRMSHGRV